MKKFCITLFRCFHEKTPFLLYILALLLAPDLSIAAETGCIKGDCQNNSGVMVYHNGSRYEGGFKDGKYSGQGVFYFANGSIYEGEYENGKRNGQGVYTAPSGTKYSGEFKEDIFIDQRLLVMPEVSSPKEKYSNKY